MSYPIGKILRITSGRYAFSNGLSPFESSAVSFIVTFQNFEKSSHGTGDRATEKRFYRPFCMVKLKFLNNRLPFKLLVSPFTSSILFPGSRSGVKIIPGYLRVEGLISSIFSFSIIFLRLVVCFDFEALALKRAINSCKFLFAVLQLFYSA